MGSLLSLGLGVWQTLEGKKESTKQRHMVERANIQAMRDWKKYAYPKAAAVEAQEEGAKAEMAASRKQAEQRLGEIGAAAGWGPGSGSLAKQSGILEGQYLSDLAKLHNQLIQYRNTPMWAPPSLGGGMQGTYGSTERGNWGNISTNVSDAFNTTSGYLNTLFGGGGGGYDFSGAGMGNLFGGLFG